MNNLKRHFGQKAAFVSAIICVALSLPYLLISNSGIRLLIYFMG